MMPSTIGGRPRKLDDTIQLQNDAVQLLHVTAFWFRLSGNIRFDLFVHVHRESSTWHLPEEFLYQPGRPHLLVCCRSPWRTYILSCSSIPPHLRASSCST